MNESASAVRVTVRPMCPELPLLRVLETCGSLIHKMLSMLAPCDTLGREPPSAGTWPGSPGHNRRSAAIIADPPKRGVQRPRLQPETIGCAWGTRMLEMTGPQGLRERAPYPASPVRAARQPDCT